MFLFQNELAAALARLIEVLPLIPPGWENLFASAIEDTAGAFALSGQPERAACLYGFAEAFRETTGASRFPIEHPDYERRVSRLRSVSDAESLARFWAKGRAMTSEEAVACALEGVGQSYGLSEFFRWLEENI
ncbi:MAG: hypothetical protein IT210_12390 [Armatimonadetes bacterium]|nr:hypothetical protein [Armatimonadota bacterium]